jgi:signal transduction histidine kinase
VEDLAAETADAMLAAPASSRTLSASRWREALSRSDATRTVRPHGRRARCALLAWLLAAIAAASEAQPPVKQVLLLQSFDRGILVLDHFTSTFRLGLAERVGQPVNVVQVVVTPTGAVGASEQAVVDYIQSIFADRPAPDLVVTVAGPAAAFARKHRQQIFPETPLLFASVDHRWIRDAPLRDNETTIAVVNDFPRLVDDILRVLPETRQVFMVTGSGPIGRFWRKELDVEFARFRDRVTFLWSDEMNVPEIFQRCANLPENSAIVFLSFGVDAQGGSYADEPVLAQLSATASSPLFAAQSPLLGHGIVGGTMVEIGDLGRSAAEATSRILNGTPPERLRVAPRTASVSLFDWRELRRWGIAESRLPPGSVVRYRGPTLWEQYRLEVLGTAAALLLQTFLITWLLVERRARRRAEVASRRNLALAADANRRETMAALTSSIGHELGQPLSAMMHNAQALQMMLAAASATPEATAEIAADIQAEAVLATRIIDRHRTMLRSRQLDKKPIDLHSVVDESLALLAHDLASRGIEPVLDLASAPCTLEGDSVLLQQVLVNLVRNATDALAEVPSDRRLLTIRSQVGPSEVALAVCDTGPGLPAEVVAGLFTPFTTTKSQGLGIGLTIARTIVEAHGGTIGAHSNLAGGATFTVTLPRGGAPR